MKAFMVLALWCAGLHAMGQESEYTVKGKLSGMSDDIKMVVVNGQGEEFRFDTLEMKNGRFEYRGRTDKRKTLTLMRLSAKEREEIQKKWKGRKGMIMSGKFDLTVFVYPGAVVEINGDQKDFPFLDISSTDEFNRGLMELQRLNLQEWQGINRLHDALNEAVLDRDTVAMMKVNQQQKAMREKIGQRTATWIASHPDSEYALWLYLNSGLTYKTVEELRGQYDRFTPEVQRSVSGTELAEIIRVRSALQPGADVPDFTLKNIYSGEDIHLADYRGKYVLLDFWASWCMPCRNSHPHLIRMAEKYKDCNFVLLGIASDRQDSVIVQAARKDGICWPQMNIYEKREGQAPLQKLYDVSALPTKILISPEGKIVARYVGNTADIDQRLKEIFGF